MNRGALTCQERPREPSALIFTPRPQLAQLLGVGLGCLISKTPLARIYDTPGVLRGAAHTSWEVLLAYPSGIFCFPGPPWSALFCGPLLLTLTPRAPERAAPGWLSGMWVAAPSRLSGSLSYTQGLTPIRHPLWDPSPQRQGSEQGCWCPQLLRTLGLRRGGGDEVGQMSQQGSQCSAFLENRE